MLRGHDMVLRAVLSCPYEHAPADACTAVQQSRSCQPDACEPGSLPPDKAMPLCDTGMVRPSNFGSGHLPLSREEAQGYAQEMPQVALISSRFLVAPPRKSPNPDLFFFSSVFPRALSALSVDMFVLARDDQAIQDFRG